VAEGHERGLAQVDRAHMRTVRTFRLPSFPYRIAAGAARAWVGNGYAGTVTQIDASRGLVSPPRRPEPSSTGRLALAYGAGSLWVGSQDNALTRIDPATGRTIARVPGVIAPEAIVAGSRAIWVAQAIRAALLRVDPRSDRIVRSIPLGGSASAVAVSTDAVWALTPRTQRIWRIDPRSNAVTAVVDVGPDVTDIALAGGSVWTAAASTGNLQRISARTQSVVQTIALGRPLGGIAADHRRIWVTVR
jgi:DNA-binding beta-propeller fold protein YncE